MAEALTALHGDSWESPRWAVAINGTSTDLSQWYIRAQARQKPDAVDAVLEWTVAGGGIVLGTAEVKLSDGTMLTTGTVQLQLKPADWVSVPRKWSGVLDVELSTDASAAPAERRTVVSARRFQIIPDVSRG